MACTKQRKIGAKAATGKRTKESAAKVPTGPRLLTLKNAAYYLGLSEWAMRERVWAGHIPVVRFPGGRKLYFDVEDLEAFIEKNKRVIT